VIARSVAGTGNHAGTSDATSSIFPSPKGPPDVYIHYGWHTIFLHVCKQQFVLFLNKIFLRAILYLPYITYIYKTLLLEEISYYQFSFFYSGKYMQCNERYGTTKMMMTNTGFFSYCITPALHASQPENKQDRQTCEGLQTFGERL